MIGVAQDFSTPNANVPRLNTSNSCKDGNIRDPLGNGIIRANVVIPLPAPIAGSDEASRLSNVRVSL